MPTYEYECQKCGKIFEAFQKMTDKPLIKCQYENCKGKVKRLIGKGAGIIFKGTGFYETDYKKKTPSDSSKSRTDKDNSACSGCAKKETCH